MLDAVSFLPWLLPVPEDFRKHVKALAASDAPDIGVLRRLAATAMTVDQLGQFAKTVRALSPHLRAAGLSPLRLGLVGSHTLDYLAPSLEATGVRHGLVLDAVKADYGQVMQAVHDPQSWLGGSSLDAVLLCLDARFLSLDTARLEPGEAAASIDAAITMMGDLCRAIRDGMGAMVILQTIPPPADPLFGNLDARVDGSPFAMVKTFNQRLVEEVLKSGDLLVDVASLAASHGLARWHDPRGWHTAKLPFSLDVAPLHADHVCRVLGAAKGKARKCLVLDLDNTLWGGVIGDDGLEGIRIGQGDAVGEAHLAIQTLALDLRQRGIILAVCSKNDKSNARLPFQAHRDMILREEHFAAFVANWSDKASNLRQIAATLNIGTDALVFLDDNPAEREIVRRELPEVAVPEVGDDAALYTSLLSGAGYFEAIVFGAEDRKRADYYRANAERQRAAGTVTNLKDYLASLEMVLHAAPFDAQGRARIAQLTNKSNQFNLTTRRYTEDQIAAFGGDPSMFTLQFGWPTSLATMA